MRSKTTKGDTMLRNGNGPIAKADILKAAADIVDAGDGGGVATRYKVADFLRAEAERLESEA